MGQTMNFSEKATPKLASERVLKCSRATADGVMPDKSDAKVQSPKPVRLRRGSDGTSGLRTAETVKPEGEASKKEHCVLFTHESEKGSLLPMWQWQESGILASPSKHGVIQSTKKKKKKNPPFLLPLHQIHQQILTTPF